MSGEVIGLVSWGPIVDLSKILPADSLGPVVDLRKIVSGIYKGLVRALPLNERALAPIRTKCKDLADAAPDPILTMQVLGRT